MFKKLLVATAILTSSSVAFAGVPYIGASIGVNNTQYNAKVDDVGTTLNLGGRNPNFNIFGGYGAVVNQNIYVGGEVFANTTTGDTEAYTSGSGATTLKYETRYTYGVSLIPGLMLSEHTMAYGRLGVVRGNFNVKATTPVASSNDDDSVAGAQAGVGIQTNLIHNVDLRAEYVYSDYRSFTENNVKTSPTSDQFNLGLVYKFE
jgi:opacity protein-like surface antigen